MHLEIIDTIESSWKLDKICYRTRLRGKQWQIEFITFFFPQTRFLCYLYHTKHITIECFTVLFIICKVVWVRRSTQWEQNKQKLMLGLIFSKKYKMNTGLQWILRWFRWFRWFFHFPVKYLVSNEWSKLLERRLQ